MSYGLFEHLASMDAETRKVKNAGRAIVAARSRVERRFGTFVQKAASADEREERIRLVSDDLLGVVHAACMEHDYGQQDEIQKVLTKVLAHLRTAGRTTCKNCGKVIETSLGADEPAAHSDATGTDDDPSAPGDYDDVCAQCDYDRENSGYEGKEAAAPLPVEGEKDKKCEWCGGKGSDGSEPCGPCKGSGWAKTKTADSNNPTSYAGGTEAPDKDTSLDVSLDNGRPDFIDVKSKRHPSETQSVEDSPTDEDYAKDGLDAATNDAVTKTLDTDTPIGSEETGPKTQTFDGAGQAKPVTSKLRIV